MTAFIEAASPHTMTTYARLPIAMDHGQGCYVWDANGKRYLDGLAGLYTVNAGHGRSSIAAAMAEQAEALAYFPLWSYTHPVAIELAARLASLAPGDLNRAFFTTGGGEAVESAWKLARQYHAARGEPNRYKAIARQTAYHGTTMGALSLTGVAEIRGLFEPLVPGGIHVENTNRYRCAFCASGPACTLQCADDIERAILREGADTVAAVFLEPVQNSGGCFTPPPGYFQRVREICDRHGVLLVSDEVICAFGRLGAYFGAERVGSEPDMITMAKGLTSGYAPLGGVMVSDRVAEPFLEEGSMFMHGITFGGHPVSCAAAMANLAIIEDEGLLERAVRIGDRLGPALGALVDEGLASELRGTDGVWALGLGDGVTPAAVRDHMLAAGVIPRPIPAATVAFCPPLVIGDDDLDLIVDATRKALADLAEAQA